TKVGLRIAPAGVDPGKRAGRCDTAGLAGIDDGDARGTRGQMPGDRGADDAGPDHEHMLPFRHRRGPRTNEFACVSRRSGLRKTSQLAAWAGAWDNTHRALERRRKPAMKRFILLAAALALTAPAAAHHGWGSYDAAKPIPVSGPIL